jgi:hypothetical protein
MWPSRKNEQPGEGREEWKGDRMKTRTEKRKRKKREEVC